MQLPTPCHKPTAIQNQPKNTNQTHLPYLMHLPTTDHKHPSDITNIISTKSQAKLRPSHLKPTPSKPIGSLKPLPLSFGLVHFPYDRVQCSCFNLKKMRCAGLGLWGYSG